MPRHPSKPSKVPKSVKRYVNKVLDKRIEDKFISKRMVDYFDTVGNSWVEMPFAINQGDGGKDERIGRRVRLKSLEIRGTLIQGSSQSSLDDPYNNMRIIVGLWQGSAGTAPLNTGSLSINDPLMKEYGYKGLIRKYCDKYVHLPVASNASTGYAPGMKHFRLYKKFKNLYITYATDDANNPDKNLIIHMISDSIAVPSPAFEIGYALLKYEDA